MMKIESYGDVGESACVVGGGGCQVSGITGGNGGCY